MTTTQKSGPQAIKRIVSALAGIGLASFPYLAFANPVDGKVVAGVATIRQESPTKVGVMQVTDKAIIDWKSFSIGVNEHVQFYQNSANSVVLNRVVGEDPSQILGRMNANGQVFLVNTNGIFFGKNAQIDVAGLVASTHNIRNEDFLAGKYIFNMTGKPGAAVINEGTINIADTGIAAFVAASVANRGVIVAKLGKIALSAANGFTLDFHGDELLTFQVSDEVAKLAFDIEGKQLTSFVENSGRIEAQGGYVLLTAKAAENVIHSVINQSGVIEATTVGTQNGEIILNAGKHSLNISGTLDASAPNGGDGGFIETSGGHVAIDPGTKITTEAPFGKNGNWLIDPTDFTVSTTGDISGAGLAAFLATSNVEIQTLATGSSGNGDIFVKDTVTWNTQNKLTLTAHHNIVVSAPINASGGGAVNLRADSLGQGAGTVNFSGFGRVNANAGAVTIFYNPTSYFDASTKSDTSGNPYSPNVTLINGASLTAFMLINDATHLQAMNTNLSGKYALGASINASGFSFNSIGNFSGVFNGDGHIIDGLNSLSNGLFSNVLPGGIVKNIGLININIQSSSDFGRIGGLVGSNEGIVINSYASGSVINYGGYSTSTGGAVGWNEGEVINAYASGIVSGGDGVYSSHVGGLVGINRPNGIVKSSFSSSNVIGTNGTASGGLVGTNFGEIYKSNASGDINLSGSVVNTTAFGGLVGVNADALIEDSYATGTVAGGNVTGGLVGYNISGTITNSYSLGGVSGTWLVGGFAGSNVVGNSGRPTSISNSYWNTDTTPSLGSAGGVGKTTSQLKEQATFTGWNFTNTWQINEGASYPTHRRATTSSTTEILLPKIISGSPSPEKIDACQIGQITCSSTLPDAWKWLTQQQLQEINSGSILFGQTQNVDLNALWTTAFDLRSSVDSAQNYANSILDGIPDYELPESGGIKLKDFLRSQAEIRYLANSWDDSLNLPLESFHGSLSYEKQAALETATKTQFDNAKAAIDLVNSGQLGQVSVWESLKDSFGESSAMMWDVAKATPVLAKYEAKILLGPVIKTYDVYKAIRAAGETASNAAKLALEMPEVIGAIADATNDVRKLSQAIIECRSSCGDDKKAEIASAISGLSKFASEIQAKDQGVFGRSLGIFGDLISAVEAAKAASLSLSTIDAIKALPSNVISDSQRELLINNVTRQSYDKALDTVISAGKVISAFVPTVKNEVDFAGDLKEVLQGFANTAYRNEANALSTRITKNDANAFQLRLAIINRSGGLRNYAETLGEIGN